MAERTFEQLAGFLATGLAQLRPLVTGRGGTSSITSLEDVLTEMRQVVQQTTERASELEYASALVRAALTAAYNGYLVRWQYEVGFLHKTFADWLMDLPNALQAV